VTAPIVGVFGVGLIGGSVALRARANGSVTVGYDDDPTALAAALDVGALQEAVARDALYERSEIVVIAAHLNATIAEVERLSKWKPLRARLIVDVGSVKVPVCAAAATLAHFVGTHPMAGSERSGAAAARADLFEGRMWAFVPSGDRQLDERARTFIASLGALPAAVEAAEHDGIVAFTSHVPQIAAWTYGEMARGFTGQLFDRLTGPAARELLRLGRSEFPMWRDILRANRANVAPKLRSLGQRLVVAAGRLEAGDVEAVAPEAETLGLTPEKAPDILP
jgi:prephenate dehydrogenase